MKNMNRTREELFRIVAEALDVPVTEVDANASSATLPQWDSLRHFVVVLFIEGAFGVSFTTGEAPTLDSVRAWPSGWRLRWSKSKWRRSRNNSAMRC